MVWRTSELNLLTCPKAVWLTVSRGVGKPEAESLAGTLGFAQSHRAHDRSGHPSASPRFDGHVPLAAASAVSRCGKVAWTSWQKPHPSVVAPSLIDQLCSYLGGQAWVTNTEVAPISASPGASSRPQNDNSRQQPKYPIEASGLPRGFHPETAGIGKHCGVREGFFADDGPLTAEQGLRHPPKQVARTARHCEWRVRVFCLAVIPTVLYSIAVSKLRRPFLSGRYFFIAVRLLRCSGR
jgi:hypothetical protein